MSQVVHVNATDRHIKYSDPGPNVVGTLFLGGESHLFFMFRGSMDPFLFISALTSQSSSGTGITIYGRHPTLANTTSYPSFELDGHFTRMVLNGTTSGDEVSPMYHSNNMEDGDHQLKWLPDKFATRIEIAYFECAVPLPRSIPRTLC